MSIESNKLMNLADGKVLYDDLRERAESVVEVSTTEPTSENNKLWIDNTESATGVQVPTYAELTELSSALSSKVSEPQTEGTNGQVLTTDGNGGRSWTTPSGGGGTITDVQVNGTSVVSQGVANVPIATIASGSTESSFGVIRVRNGYDGLKLNPAGTSPGRLTLNPTTSSQIKSGNDGYLPVTTARQHEATFYGLAKASGDSTQSASSNAVGVYTESAKSSISQMLDAPETVSGTTPSITAKAGVRYICGEVSTLTIVVPSTGIIDVRFESGSTATVLTVTPPTGMTMKWANGFDPTSLEDNKTYELNIMDGCLGVGASWT